MGGVLWWLAAIGLRCYHGLGSSCRSSRVSSNLSLGAVLHLPFSPLQVPKAAGSGSEKGVLKKKTYGSEIWAQVARVDRKGKKAFAPQEMRMCWGLSRWLCRVTIHGPEERYSAASFLTKTPRRNQVSHLHLGFLPYTQQKSRESPHALPPRTSMPGSGNLCLRMVFPPLQNDPLSPTHREDMLNCRSCG